MRSAACWSWRVAASNRAGIDRLERVSGVRQTMVSVAETRVRETENVIRDIQLEDARIVRQIHDLKAEISHHSGLTGHHVQQNERCVEGLTKKRAAVLQRLEKAKLVLAERRQEWIEAQREKKIIERVQERRLLEWRQQEDIAQQKSADDAFIGRVVRSRSL